MNGMLLGAAVLALLLAVVHGVGGEVTALRNVARAPASDQDKLLLGAVWHLYTWQLALTALLLFAQLGGRVPSSPATRAYVAATFLGGALLISVFAARRGVAALARNPQWIFLGLLGALAWWAP